MSRLHFSDVCVSLGSTPIVHDAHGSFEPGTVTALLGPNGAGKSTLLRALAGLLPVTCGRIRLDDAELGDLSVRERARLVAMVPQHPALDFHFSAREVVMMGRHPHIGRFGTESARDHAAVDVALATTCTEELVDRDTATLSGGERQLVFIAKAIAQDTPVVLLDEPISALDVAHQLQVLQLMRALADEGRTVVAALHDLDLAARIADQAYVVGKGHVQAQGTPAEVLTPTLMRQVFGVDAHIGTDPVTGTPTVAAYALSDHTESHQTH